MRTPAIAVRKNKVCLPHAGTARVLRKPYFLRLTREIVSEYVVRRPGELRTSEAVELPGKPEAYKFLGRSSELLCQRATSFCFVQR